MSQLEKQTGTVMEKIKFYVSKIETFRSKYFTIYISDRSRNCKQIQILSSQTEIIELIKLQILNLLSDFAMQNKVGDDARGQEIEFLFNHKFSVSCSARFDGIPKRQFKYFEHRKYESPLSEDEIKLFYLALG